MKPSGANVARPPSAAHVDRPPSADSRRAFSLVEMMIALVILGFGLLVIGAALPIGLTYTRESVDRGTGAAAAEHALDVIEQHVRTVRYEYPAEPTRRDDLFRPRQVIVGSNPSMAEVRPSYEPLIKVRPFAPQVINRTPGAASWTMPNLEPGAAIELRVQTWVNNTALGGLEYDVNRRNPALSFASMVYPPLDPFPFRDPSAYYTDATDQTLTPLPAGASQARQALDRQIVCTAFYRRVSYDHPISNPQGIFNLANPDLVRRGDSSLYEVIVVASRLPSARHRFPVLRANFSSLDSGVSAAGGIGGTATLSPPYANIDSHVPIPYLVAFDTSMPGAQALPIPNAVTSYTQAGYMAPAISPPYYEIDRTLTPAWVDPPTLTFRCTPMVGKLLPVGSVFIPAVNDDAPAAATAPPPGAPPTRNAGFVPHSPSTLPIYEVVERPDDFTVITKNPGVYPWVKPGNTAAHWPIWVIPPAFVELSAGMPVYETRSTIVAVSRRVMRFPEVP
ncbi:hypothetical protein RAS1_29300 [Phycisphaerae bacterium RAS1]|nr:hypothetical protein RAS1_29300 [Phycisphaerae bacterium RAS1]